MIPLKLTLNNFMCYRYAELDMSHIQLACLSGDNGAGKSALLDAITWVLWNEARVRGADELITMGEVEMSISLTFEVANQLYNVIRKRNRKAGSSILELQIRNEKSGWTRISESGIPATQRKIIEIIKMSHDTFINSAYLQQGKADEFTRKTATQRKEILCDILGLSYYDELEKKAKESARAADTIRKNLEEKLREIEQELAKRPIFEEEFHDAQKLVLLGQRQIAEQEKVLEERKNIKGILDTLQTQLENADKRLQNSNRELDGIRRKIEETQRHLKIAQQVIDRRAEIEKGYQDYQVAHQAEFKISQKQKEYFELDKKRQRLEILIERAKTGLENERKNATSQLSEQTALAKALAALQSESVVLHNDLDKAVKAFEEMEQTKKEQAVLREEMAAQQTEVKRLEREMEVLKKKAEQVPKPGDKCDRCGTILDESAREHTLEEYRTAYRECQTQAKEAKTLQEQVKAKIEALDGQIKTLEKTSVTRTTLMKQVGTLEEKLKAAEQAEQNVANLQKQLVAIQQTLEGKQYAVEEQGELAKNASALKALAYSPEEHQKATAKRSQLDPYREEHVRLQNAEKTREEKSKELAHLADEEAQKLLTIAGEEKEILELRSRLQGYEQVTREVNELTLDLYSSRKKEKEAIERRARADEMLKRLEKLADDRAKVNADFQKSASEKDIFEELAMAFGKKGLQAMVIDTALPELEEEANRLLGAMSDGRMSVRFDTQKSNKRGDTVETLDLLIADEAGSRSYDLFSGGEAFRVNFAIRVALSKLLARRSGAQLRTLIIDEGFGTQDAQGRERLVEAIRSIEQEFERVLVITHIPELKDVFPVRIDVTKTAAGSVITVN